MELVKVPLRSLNLAADPVRSLGRALDCPNVLIEALGEPQRRPGFGRHPAHLRQYSGPIRLLFQVPGLFGGIPGATFLDGGDELPGGDGSGSLVVADEEGGVGGGGAEGGSGGDWQGGDQYGSGGTGLNYGPPRPGEEELEDEGVELDPLFTFSAALSGRNILLSWDWDDGQVPYGCEYVAIMQSETRYPTDQDLADYLAGRGTNTYHAATAGYLAGWYWHAEADGDPMRMVTQGRLSVYKQYLDNSSLLSEGIDNYYTAWCQYMLPAWDEDGNYTGDQSFYSTPTNAIYNVNELAMVSLTATYDMATDVIDLVWVYGGGTPDPWHTGVYAIIMRRDDGTYPTGIDDPDAMEVYRGIEALYTDTDVSAGSLYQYAAWAVYGTIAAPNQVGAGAQDDAASPLFSDAFAYANGDLGTVSVGVWDVSAGAVNVLGQTVVDANAGGLGVARTTAVTGFIRPLWMWIDCDWSAVPAAGGTWRVRLEIRRTVPTVQTYAEVQYDSAGNQWRLYIRTSWGPTVTTSAWFAGPPPSSTLEVIIAAAGQISAAYGGVTLVHTAAENGTMYLTSGFTIGRTGGVGNQLVGDNFAIWATYP